MSISSSTRTNGILLAYSNIMTPEAALDKQIEMYRNMTGEQRLDIALRLHSLSLDIARAGIRDQHPHANAEEIEKLLRQRIALVTAP